MIDVDLRRVLRHSNDALTHPFASERSPGSEDFARLLRNLEGAELDRLSAVLDAIDGVMASHEGCHTCRGKILVFCELLSINRLPERHAGYAQATENIARETGRDYRREVLEHLSSFYRSVRPRIRARELLDRYQEMTRRLPWALHLEGLSEELAVMLSGKSEWFLIMGRADSEKAIERIQSGRAGGMEKSLDFAIAHLIHDSISPEERCALFWSRGEGEEIHAWAIDAMLGCAMGVWYENSNLRVFRNGEVTGGLGTVERVNEAVGALLGLNSPPFIRALLSQPVLEVSVRHGRGGVVYDPRSSKMKSNTCSKRVLGELRCRRQQRVHDALNDPNLPEDARMTLVNCMPLWKDEPDTIIGELIPQPRRRAGAKAP